MWFFFLIYIYIIQNVFITFDWWIVYCQSPIIVQASIFNFFFFYIFYIINVVIIDFLHLFIHRNNCNVDYTLIHTFTLFPTFHRELYTHCFFKFSFFIIAIIKQGQNLLFLSINISYILFSRIRPIISKLKMVPTNRNLINGTHVYIHIFMHICVYIHVYIYKYLKYCNGMLKKKKKQNQ